MSKKALRAVIGNVAVWRIFRCDVQACREREFPRGVTCRAIGAEEISALPDELLAEQAWYCGSGAEAFAGSIEPDAIVGLCFHWDSSRYNLQQFWPVSEKETMLMQIITSPQARGRGVARALIQHSARAAAERGIQTVWARIWITNAASRAAFKAAGWRQVAWVIEINPFRRRAPYRLRLPCFTRPAN